MYIDIHVYISLQSKTNMSHNSHSIKPGICSHFIKFKGCSVFEQCKIYICMLLHIRKYYLGILIGCHLRQVTEIITL